MTRQQQATSHQKASFLFVGGVPRQRIEEWNLKPGTRSEELSDGAATVFSSATGLRGARKRCLAMGGEGGCNLMSPLRTRSLLGVRSLGLNYGFCYKAAAPSMIQPTSQVFDPELEFRVAHSVSGLLRVVGGCAVPSSRHAEDAAASGSDLD